MIQNQPVEAQILQHFLDSPIRSYALGFKCYTMFPLWMLSCLLNEDWLDDGVLNALAELAYFRSYTIPPLLLDFPVSEPPPSPYLILPTTFLQDLQALYPREIYNFNLRSLHDRLQKTPVSKIIMLSLNNQHYSTYVYSTEDGSLTHYCTLGSYPLPLELFCWFLKGVPSLPQPDTIIAGDGPIQPAGSGSCGIAAYTEAMYRAGIEPHQWSHRLSSMFRNEALVNLITLNWIAKKSVGSLLF
jgi:hypothetical protein